MKPHQPVHKLHRLEISVILPTLASGRESSIAVAGRSDTKRASLWHYAESFDATTVREKGYQMHDAVAHIVLASSQDRPRSLAQLEFALRGGIGWEEPPLF